MANVPPMMMKLVMPVSLTSILMELLAIRLSPQAGKLLVISQRERKQSNRCASFTLTQVIYWSRISAKAVAWPGASWC